MRRSRALSISTESLDVENGQNHAIRSTRSHLIAKNAKGTTCCCDRNVSTNAFFAISPEPIHRIGRLMILSASTQSEDVENVQKHANRTTSFSPMAKNAQEWRLSAKNCWNHSVFRDLARAAGPNDAFEGSISIYRISRSRKWPK